MLLTMLPAYADNAGSTDTEAEDKEKYQYIDTDSLDQWIEEYI